MTIHTETRHPDLSNLRIELVQDARKFIDHVALRYRAYLCEDAIPATDDEIFVDRYDFQRTSLLFGVVDQDGKTVGSVRFAIQPPRSICPNDFCSSPEFVVYGDVFQTLPDADRLIVTGARFSIEPNHPMRRHIALILMHALVLAASAIKARWALLTARGNHLRFYQRVLMMDQWTEPRPMPGLSYSYALMITDVDKVAGQVIDNHPAVYRDFFRAYAPHWKDQICQAAKPLIGLGAG